MLAVDYASAVAIELHSARNSSSEPTVNVRFKNGTTDHTFHDVQIFGQRYLPLSQFISKLAVRSFQSASRAELNRPFVAAHRGQQHPAVVHCLQPDVAPWLFGVPSLTNVQGISRCNVV